MIVLVGLDHRRASVETRGRLSFTGARLHDSLTTLRAQPGIAELVILSTCNRTELYLAASNTDMATSIAHAFLEETAEETAARVIAGASAPSGAGAAVATELRAALYTIIGVDAVAHLYRVSAGLRSMVLGEAQILGQVRDAFVTAETAGACGEELRAAFSGALQAGKRVRSETGISRNDDSVASIAVHAARERLGTLAGAAVTLVGAGKTSALAARLLRQEGIARLSIANRHIESARALAEQYGANTVTFADLPAAIATSDALISATAAPYVVITEAMVAPRDPGHPLLIVDLAVPADVSHEVGQLPGVTVINLDALHDLPGNALEEPSIAASLRERQADLDQAENIIQDLLREYVKAQTLRIAAPGIAALRRHVDASQEQELARALAQLSHLSERDRDVVERFGARLVDKMFHHLVRRIRTLAEYDEIPPETTMRVLAQLFMRPDSAPDDQVPQP